MRKFSFRRNNDLTVESIIKIQEDLENSRASGHDVTVKDAAVRSDQFQATRRWNMILSQFYKNMPRKKNRRQWRQYPDSFTGKEASEFLLTLFPKVVPNKPFDSSNTEKFMQLLLTKQLVENVREPNNKSFHANASLYRFVDDKIKEEIDATKPIQRASSLTDLRSLAKSDSFCKQVNASVKKLRRSISANTLNKDFQSLKLSTSPRLESSNQSTITASTYQKKAHTSVPPKSTPENDYEMIKCRSSPAYDPIDAYVTGDDYLLAWKQLLLRFVGLQSVSDKLSEGIIGAHIKWNCTEVGEKGIVRCPNPKDDLPLEIKKDFQALLEWRINGNEQGQSSNKVFDHLYGLMCVNSPIVPYDFSFKLSVLWKHFHKRFSPDAYDNPFYRNDDPNFSLSNSSVGKSTFASSSLSSGSPNIKYIDEFETPITINSKSRYERTLRTTKSNSASNVNDSKEMFYGAVQAMLLTLKPDIRRRLNIVCRYMKRLQENSDLKLHESKTNLAYLLEKLAPCIIDFGVNLPMKQTFYFVSMLVESHTLLFSPSSSLVIAARRYCASGRKNAPAPQTTAFCRRIPTAEYEKEKSNTDAELMRLLDGIILNENMGPSEKAKKLESFKKTYPHLYAKRFPNEMAGGDGHLRRNPTPTRKLVQRIRSLTRKDSARNN